MEQEQKNKMSQDLLGSYCFLPYSWEEVCNKQVGTGKLKVLSLFSGGGSFKGSCGTSSWFVTAATY